MFEHKCTATDDGMSALPEVSTGTTIMAVEFDGGIVIGADSRTSAGQYVVNRASRKVTQLHHRIFCARSGSAADTQALSQFVKRFLQQNALEMHPDLPLVNTAASLMQLMCYQNKNHLLAGLIVAGWDSEEGGQVYQIPLGGAKLRTHYAIGGSGSSYIAAFVEANYRDRMTQDECVEFVKTSIAHAMNLDGSSGGVIRLTVVTEHGCAETIVTGDQLPHELP